MYSFSLHKTLHDLPNELLLLIVEYIGEQRHLPRKFRAIYALSQVNRRLRAFCAPHLYRHLHFSSSEKYHKFASHSRFPTSDIALHVRSIYIGSELLFLSDKPPASLHRGFRCPFPYLHSFECLNRIPESVIMAKLSSCSQLKNLALVWPTHWPFPELRFNPQLETLRLKIVHKQANCPFAINTVFGARIRCHPSITTLHIMNFPGADWPDKRWIRCTFPNLRVFNLQNTETTPRSVYDFIQCHSTLLEVNVTFNDEVDLRLEGIIKLIEGTGTWRAPDDLTTWQDAGDVRRYYLTGEGKKRFLDEPSQTHTEVRLFTFPDDIPGTRFTTDSFAFKRVSLTPEATEWRRREGSVVPRYKATQLSLQLTDQSYLQLSGTTFAHFHDFFLLADKFPAVETLRVMSRTFVPPDDFVPYMVLIGSRLEKWKNLRELAICFAVNEDVFEWGMTEPEIEPFLAAPGIRPFYDYVIPPTERWSSSRFYTDLDMFRNDPCMDDLEEANALVDRVQAKLDLDFSSDAEDLARLMRIWETRNEPRVARVMRCIARMCPTLEQLDWYPMGSASDGESYTAWRWKFLRKLRDGKLDVDRVIGNLRWENSVQGDPDPIMENLVGEEWDRYRKSRKREY
ncbi:unnamed protein product [Somion occarium]|uniref:F-box domain-containing protein n=1 Tax=Somion occarium TaxID=3059160 RepID=A0ABP1CH21_9APHY